MQIPNHTPQASCQIKKIKLNQIFKPALHHKPREKTGATLWQKKHSLSKPLNMLNF
jgi:hypothetical protein